MKVITSATQALDNIGRLQIELAKSPELAERLGMVHAWYVDTRDTDQPRFGFSKFVGYQNMDASTYLRDYKELTGINTEWALKEFFDEVEPESRRFKEYHEQLSNWLGDLGRTARKKVRIMVLNPKFVDDDPKDDRSLLELLKKVSATLPAHQRSELRNSL